MLTGTCNRIHRYRKIQNLVPYLMICVNIQTNVII